MRRVCISLLVGVGSLILVMVWLLGVARAQQLAPTYPLDDKNVVEKIEVGSDLYLAITQLAYHYSIGLDSISAGDVQTGTTHLRIAFTDDAEFVYEFPPLYASLNLKAGGGAEGLAKLVTEFYRALNIIRTQHVVTNLMIERLGPNKAI